MLSIKNRQSTPQDILNAPRNILRDIDNKIFVRETDYYKVIEAVHDLLKFLEDKKNTPVVKSIKSQDMQQFISSMELLYPDKIESTAHFCYTPSDGNFGASKLNSDVFVTIKYTDGHNYERAFNALKNFGSPKIITSPGGINYLSISDFLKGIGYEEAMKWSGFLKAVKFFQEDKGILTKVYQKLLKVIGDEVLTDFKLINFANFHFEAHIANEYVFNGERMTVPPEVQEIIEAKGKVPYTLTIGLLNKTYRISAAEDGIVIPGNAFAWKFNVPKKYKTLLDDYPGLQSELYRTGHLPLKVLETSKSTNPFEMAMKSLGLSHHPSIDQKNAAPDISIRDVGDDVSMANTDARGTEEFFYKGSVEI